MERKWIRCETCRNFISSFTLFDRRLSSIFDASSDSNLVNPCSFSLHLAQLIDARADFKPIVNWKSNLNGIYINEDAMFDDECEKDSVLKVLQMLVKTFSKRSPFYFRRWVAREQVATRDEIPPSSCDSSRMKHDTTAECLVFVWCAELNLKTIQLWGCVGITFSIHFVLWVTSGKIEWQLIQGSAPAFRAAEVWTFWTVHWSHTLPLPILECSTVLL